MTFYYENYKIQNMKSSTMLEQCAEHELRGGYKIMRKMRDEVFG